MTDNFDFTLWTDTEKTARIEKLRQSKPIEITGNEVPYSENLWQYRKNTMEYGKTLRGIYTNKDTLERILLAREGIGEILRHDSFNPIHLQTIAAIPQIIESGIYIDTAKNEDKEKHPTIKEYKYYVCGLKINGTDYTIKAVIAVDRNGNRYYDHALTQIEKGKLLIEAARITSPPRQQGVNPIIEYKDKRLFSILQIKNVKTIGGVELSYEQRQLLTLGEAIKLYDITDKQGKKRNILVQWNTNANKLKISEIKAEHIVQKVAPFAALQKILDAPSILDNGEDSPQIKRRNRGLSL